MLSTKSLLVFLSCIQSESYRIYRESVEKFEREYSAALRALHGPKKKDLLVCPLYFLFHHIYIVRLITKYALVFSRQ